MFFYLEKKRKKRNEPTALKVNQSRFSFKAFYFVSRWNSILVVMKCLKNKKEYANTNMTSKRAFLFRDFTK